MIILLNCMINTLKYVPHVIMISSHVCMNVCIYVCMYVYIYIYTYIGRLSLRQQIAAGMRVTLYCKYL